MITIELMVVIAYLLLGGCYRGQVAIFSVFGVAWMSDTLFISHMDVFKKAAPM